MYLQLSVVRFFLKKILRVLCTVSIDCKMEVFLFISLHVCTAFSGEVLRRLRVANVIVGEKEAQFQYTDGENVSTVWPGMALMYSLLM